MNMVKVYRFVDDPLNRIQFWNMMSVDSIVRVESGWNCGMIVCNAIDGKGVSHIIAYKDLGAGPYGEELPNDKVKQFVNAYLVSLGTRFTGDPTAAYAALMNAVRYPYRKHYTSLFRKEEADILRRGLFAIKYPRLAAVADAISAILENNKVKEMAMQIEIDGIIWKDPMKVSLYIRFKSVDELQRKFNDEAARIYAQDSEATVCRLVIGKNNEPIFTNCRFLDHRS
jgi:hypothetical protein